MQQQAPRTARYKTRVRWDNVLILLAAVVACAVAVPQLLQMDPKPPVPPAKQAKAEPEKAVTLDEAMEAEGPSLDEANRLVAEARVELEAGRFDRAEQLIMDITGDASDLSGASELRDEIVQARSSYEDHARVARLAVKEARWADAKASLDAAAAIAPLTGPLMELKVQVDTRLAADAAVTQSRRLLQAGKFDAALAKASAAAERYRTPELRALVKEIEQKRSRERTRRAEAAAAARREEAAAAAAGGGSAGADAPRKPAKGGENPASEDTGGASQQEVQAAIDQAQAVAGSDSMGGGDMGGGDMAGLF